MESKLAVQYASIKSNSHIRFISKRCHGNLLRTQLRAIAKIYLVGSAKYAKCAASYRAQVLNLKLVKCHALDKAAYIEIFY